LGEFNLIDKIAELIQKDSTAADANLILNIGDDTAAWKNKDAMSLITVDCLVENIHFRTKNTTPNALGWKALAVSLSDIAAMGGIPKYALFSLALPAETETEYVLDIYKGILELANKFGTKIIGGNISKAPLLFIDSVVYGVSADPNVMLTRSAAKPGDLIAVTGDLGAAAGGLKIIEDNLTFADEIKKPLTEGLNQPYPRIKEGQKLAAGGVKCAMDLSDGLVIDLGHICKASGVGAIIEIESIPIHPELKAAFGENAIDLALSGGEDYELLFTAEPQVIEKIKKQTDCRITVIGKIIADDNRQINLTDSTGEIYTPPNKGWNHFG